MRKRRLTRRGKRNRAKKIVITFTFCLMFVMVVGYAAFQTNISITAKGNIIEKPHAEVGGIEVELVTDGDGLYEDEYEEGRYIYKGTNPDNYITFSGETWRIISVESDGIIKIMRNESIGNMQWDSSNSNNWARPATLNTYLNEEYLPTLSDSDKVVSHSWSIGAVKSNNSDLSAQITSENGTTWNGKVGLITVSEYLRVNTNTEQCGTFSLNYVNRSVCKTTNWMFKSSLYRTISPNASDSFNIFTLLMDGTISYYSANNSYIGVRPVLYLKSDIILEGEGTEDNPYLIMN